MNETDNNLPPEPPPEGQTPAPGTENPAPAAEVQPDLLRSEPFAETPRSVGPGVGKPLAIGCVVVLVLMLVAGVVLVLNVNTLLAKSFEMIETQLTSSLPDDLPADTRSRLELAFSEARQSMDEGNFDPFAVQKAQAELSKVLGLNEDELTAERLAPLIEAVEKIPNRTD